MPINEIKDDRTLAEKNIDANRQAIRGMIKEHDALVMEVEHLKKQNLQLNNQFVQFMQQRAREMAQQTGMGATNLTGMGPTA